MSWYKKYFNNTELVIGAAHRFADSIGKILKVIPKVNFDSVLICERSVVKNGAAIFYFSPEIVKRMRTDLETFGAIVSDNPFEINDIELGHPNFVFGNLDLMDSLRHHDPTKT